MTPEEKKAQMDARNAAICAYYRAGHKLSKCSSKFKLGRQRILQILQAAEVWQPYVKSDRTNFVGSNVSDATKHALKEQADARGVSMSQLVSDQLDAMVKP